MRQNTVLICEKVLKWGGEFIDCEENHNHDFFLKTKVLKVLKV